MKIALAVFMGLACTLASVSAVVCIVNGDGLGGFVLSVVFLSYAVGCGYTCLDLASN